MPNSLRRVERASKLLEEAASMLKIDPYSQPARKMLIEGARGMSLVAGDFEVDVTCRFVVC